VTSKCCVHARYACYCVEEVNLRFIARTKCAAGFIFFVTRAISLLSWYRGAFSATFFFRFSVRSLSQSPVLKQAPRSPVLRRSPNSPTLERRTPVSRHNPRRRKFKDTRMFLGVLLCSGGDNCGRSKLKFTSFLDCWGELCWRKSVLAIRSLVLDRSLNFPIARRTLYHWAIAAQRFAYCVIASLCVQYWTQNKSSIMCVTGSRWTDT